jgi:cytoskeleton protein RodZ
MAQASHPERVPSMNPQPASDNPESSSQTVGGVGRRLGAARQARGLDLERIATLLHINPDLVESLEQERYGDLPQPVFVAGYIRNYARHVGLDPEPLVAVYQASEAHREPDRRWSEGSAEHSSGGGGGLLVRFVSIALVVGLAYLFIQWWQGRAPIGPDPIAEGGSPPDPLPAGGRGVQVSRKPESVTVAPAAPHPVQPPAAPDAPFTPPPMGVLGGSEAAWPEGLATATPVVTPKPAQGVSLGPDDPLPAETPAAPAAAADTGTTSQPAADGVVVLEFRGPCWVDIRDAAKTFSLKGEMAKGDRRVLGGAPPYELKLGNAAAVAITVNGVPFDISRVARTNSPRFKLDPTKPQ